MKDNDYNVEIEIDNLYKIAKENIEIRQKMKNMTEEEKKEYIEELKKESEELKDKENIKKLEIYKD